MQEYIPNMSKTNDHSELVHVEGINKVPVAAFLDTLDHTCPYDTSLSFFDHVLGEQASLNFIDGVGHVWFETANDPEYVQ